MSKSNTRWKTILKAISWVFVAMLFASAWGGKEAVMVFSAIACLVALVANYLATSSLPHLRWSGGLVLAGPLAALIVLNAILNPQEVGLIPVWLTIAFAIYISATIGGFLSGRN